MGRVRVKVRVGLSKVRVRVRVLELSAMVSDEGSSVRVKGLRVWDSGLRVED